jgi:hypothetical protein
MVSSKTLMASRTTPPIERTETAKNARFPPLIGIALGVRS